MGRCDFCVSKIFVPDVKFVGIMVHSLWFLKSVFICTIFYFLSCKNKKYRWILLPLSLLLSQLIQYYLIWWMYPCYLFGVLIKLGYLDLWKQNLFKVEIICIIIYIIILFFCRVKICRFNKDI